MTNSSCWRHLDVITAFVRFRVVFRSIPRGVLIAWSTILLTSPTVQAQSGASANVIVARALQANRELSAARLDLERGRARLRQAGLRPNPTLDLEHTTGRLTGSPEERDLSVGLALPLELGGARARRIDLAQAELAATEAEVAERERRLTADVLTAYAAALAAQRELHITTEVEGLDGQAMRVVQTRVEQRDAAPLELNLLRTEVERLRARRVLAEGRLSASLIALGALIGDSQDQPVTEVEPITAQMVEARQRMTTLDGAIAMALRQRPDLQMARLNELAAEAGLRLARAQAFPDMTVSGRFITSRTANDLPRPLVPVVQQDRALAFGVSIGLPFLNANQGARTEAAVAIRQAQLRREFTEQRVRAEVTSAFRRVEAARAAIAIFEHGVIDRSSDNIRVIRAAYELGEFRITELINEQRRFLDSQREYTDALVEGYRAIVDLDAAVAKAPESQP